MELDSHAHYNIHQRDSMLSAPIAVTESEWTDAVTDPVQSVYTIYIDNSKKEEKPWRQSS